MVNDLVRAAFWRDFILTRCDYPAPARLKSQFDNCRFDGFCPCGCNSFAAHPSTDVQLARRSKNGGAIFGADFHMHDGRELNILLFADADGRLDMVDVHCNANSAPMPPIVDIPRGPFAIWTAKALLLDSTP